MKISGMSAVSDFLGDFIVYRSLSPADPRLPGLDNLREEVSLPRNMIPRKNEAAYARAVAGIIKHARALDSKADIQRLIFIGDTRLLDATAFANICAEGNWPGICFIGSENSSEPKIEIEAMPGGQKLYLSNRWSALDDSFREYAASQGFTIDEHTALLSDLDKTILGARGRNAGPIDGARVQAVFETVAHMLGKLFDAQAFRQAYNLIIQPEFHPFTEDNQDNVAYICLILGSGLITLDELVADVRSRKMQSFRQFIADINRRKAELPPELSTIHHEIYAYVQSGDPTPFKPFRYNEYKITTARMGCADDSTTLEKLLSSEIVITREVRDLTLAWKAQGALAFGLSDKPDEASIPTAELASQGYVPLHRKVTHVVGE